VATTLLRQGVPIDVVQEVLGHASISTTRRYAKTSSEAILKLAATMQQNNYNKPTTSNDTITK